MPTSSEPSPADELRALLRKRQSPLTDLQRSASRLGQATLKTLRPMPVDGDLDALIQNVERYRGRPLYVLECDLGSGEGPSGCWMTTDGGVDVIFVERLASWSQRTAVVCHELARMLLDDGETEAAPVAAAILAPELAPSLVDRMLARHESVPTGVAESEN